QGLHGRGRALQGAEGRGGRGRHRGERAGGVGRDHRLAARAARPRCGGGAACPRQRTSGGGPGEQGGSPGGGGAVMAVETQPHLIAPHGGYLVDRTGPRPDNADSLEQVTLTSRELSDLDMLASGALSPLEGFMGRDDYERVLEEMRLAKGLPWALPVCLAVDHEPQGDEVTLTDESGTP